MPGPCGFSRMGVQFTLYEEGFEYKALCLLGEEKEDGEQAPTS